MNNQRRKEIAKIITQLTELQTGYVTAATAIREIFDRAIAEAQEHLDKIGDPSDIQGQVESVRDEEQEYYDNMPEGFQNSDRGELASENANQLGEAHDFLDEITTSMSEIDFDALLAETLDSLDEMAEKVGEAIGCLEGGQQ